MSGVYASDDLAGQQFFPRRHPDRIGRGLEHAVGEFGRQASAVDQEAPDAAVAFEHVVVAHAGKAGAVEAEAALGPETALDAAQEGDGAGRGAASIDMGGELAV